VPAVVTDKSLAGQAGEGGRREHDHHRGKGDKKAVEGRASRSAMEIERTDSEYDREKLQERLAKLAGGVAVIKVAARLRPP